MSAYSVNILDQARLTSASDGETKPVLLQRYNGDGSERIAPGRYASLIINRDRDGSSGALDGSIAVFGADLPHPQSSNSLVQVFRGKDGASGKTVFDTTFAHVAFDNNNWIVIVAGNVIEQGAGAGKFQVSNSSGIGRITLGTAAGDGDQVEVYRVTPSQILASGGHAFEDSSIVAKSAMWIDYTVSSGNLSRTLVTLKPAT